MHLSLDDNILETGSCFGEYDPKLDDEGRLRLPKEVVDTLRKHGVTSLYRCPDPTGERFVLCPAVHWNAFVEATKKHFADSPDAQDALRLICRGLEADIDSQGRIRITKPCLDHAKLKACQRVTLRGAGKWYETSSYEPG